METCSFYCYLKGGVRAIEVKTAKLVINVAQGHISIQNRIGIRSTRPPPHVPYEALGQPGQDSGAVRHPEAGSSWPSWPRASYRTFNPDAVSGPAVPACPLRCRANSVVLARFWPWLSDRSAQHRFNGSLLAGMRALKGISHRGLEAKLKTEEEPDTGV
jgi:hypothetical protein